MFDILWVFFVYFFLFTFLWPYVRQRMIRSERMNLIRRLELLTRSRVVTMIHRQERVSSSVYRFTGT